MDWFFPHTKPDLFPQHFSVHFLVETHQQGGSQQKRGCPEVARGAHHNSKQFRMACTLWPQVEASDCLALGRHQLFSLGG